MEFQNLTFFSIASPKNGLLDLQHMNSDWVQISDFLKLYIYHKNSLKAL